MLRPTKAENQSKVQFDKHLTSAYFSLSYFTIVQTSGWKFKLKTFSLKKKIA